MKEHGVDENWWMSIFDAMYLKTDARSVCDDHLTCQEVDFLEKCLGMRRNWRIVDLCGGQGRHALELARRGFPYIVVFDYSNYLLSVGKGHAVKETLPTSFIRGDARHMGLREGSFDLIMIMGSSFGYFVHEQENNKILSESFRLLRPEGIILLDLPDRSYVVENFKAHISHRVNDQLAVIRERRLERDVIYCRERVLDESGHCLRDNRYCTRLYSQDHIRDVLEQTGFQKIRFQTDFMPRQEKGEFGCMTNRMVVMAKKV